jgi:RND family efflux transporter MFP subunit
LLLRFSVPEQDAGRLETGMVVRFRVRETSREFGAKITHVAAAADAASRMVAVTAHVDSGPDLPRPGAFAEVSISVGGKNQAPVIPETAVRPSERGFLAYVISNGKAHERILSLGMRTDDGRVEVREGLAPAESLVVRGAEALRDGASVRIVTGTAAAPGTPNADGASGGAAAGRP